MLGMAAAPISAQADATPVATEFEDIAGLQRAYSRTFTADMMAMFDIATPDATPSGWFALTTMVLEFDSEDNARAGNEKLLEEVESSDMTGNGATMEDVELDVDMDYTAKQATQEEGGMTTYVLVATAQDGNYVYAVIGITFGEDPAGVTSAALTAMQDADAGDGEGTFNADGTSEGGLWDKLPTLKQMQEQAPAFAEAIDEVVYPESEATPAA
jgi:hypothetical protein